MRSSAREMLRKHEASPQKNNHAEAQQSHFVTLLKSNLRTDALSKNRSTRVEHPPPRKHL